MPNRLFRLCLTLNATSLLAVIYAVQKEIILLKIFSNDIDGALWNKILSYALYILLPIALTAIILLLSKRLGRDTFAKGEIISIEHANNSFLPSYLGYFFVALSINNTTAFYIVYIILFTFTFLSQALYFNPLFLLFGYEFYNVKTKTGMSLFLISKRQYKIPSEIEIECAYRINRGC